MAEPQTTVLLVNPWVRDFKCYDEWMEPLGLLWIASFLEKESIRVKFLDCLDRFVSGDKLKKGRRKKFGTGDFSIVELPKPSLYNEIPRKYKQYGISEELFLKKAREAGKPDAVLMTTGMTYWCDGTRRAVELLRGLWPDIPFFLGGILATLCAQYTKNIPGVDYVFEGLYSNYHHIAILKSIGKKPLHQIPLPCQWSTPRFDFLSKGLEHRAIVSAFGCPFQCTYCASRKMVPQYFRRPPEQIFGEIEEAYERDSIRDFAFYDDALLYNYEKHLAVILDLLLTRKMQVRFHTPNGMHARWISRTAAKALFQSGFKTLRIGFETDKPEAQKTTGGKVSNKEMEESLANLCEAGFQKHQIGVYLMVGLNGEPWGQTLRRAQWVQERGARALPNFLSPVPHTKDFNELSEKYPILKEDPRSHNDIFFAFYSGTVNAEEFNALKQKIREGNQI